jgi:hypothetical protein
VLVNLVEAHKDLKADFVRELNVEGRVNQLSRYIFGEEKPPRFHKKESQVVESA